MTEFLHRDALNSVRATSGPGGAPDRRTSFRPFGEAATQTLDPTAVREDKGFIGERFDTDAGLQYLNARYYDPKLGLFTQPDWWEVTKAGVGTNRYSYSFNDPVNLSDPNGNIIPALAVIAVLALVASSADPANAPGEGDRTLPPNGTQNMLVAGAVIATGGVAVPLITRVGATGVRSALAAETVLDVTACARGDTAACATIALPGVPGVANNAIAGAARQRENARLLQLAYPDARIQNEVYLRTANGRRAIDPLTGTARRIDHAVIDDATGTVMTLRETTSMTANKTQQQFHEQNVRNAGGTFIHDRRTGRLIDVSSTPTIVDRLP